MGEISNRPNILLAVADDASHFSAYGHSFVTTPHFDRVCSDGVRFTAAFTTNSKCAPSRASILTGRHTWQNRESCLHWNYWPVDLPVYPDMLEEAGYHVGFTGKPWAPGDWQRCGRNRNPAGAEFNEVAVEPPVGTMISTRDYAANFAKFLCARPEGAPFCFWYGGHEPHRPYIYGEGAAHGNRAEHIEAVPPYWPNEEPVRSDVLDYAYETEWFDLHLGRMLEQLETTGEIDNTLVIVTSDNGAPFPRVKGQMYEDGFRMPFAAMWPDRVPAGRVVDDLVSFIDLAPTFLEVAGLPIPNYMAGRTLTDVLCTERWGVITDYRTRAYMGRERHDLGREGDLGYPARCIRTPQHLFVRNFEPDRWPAGNPETGYTNCDSSPTKSRILELYEIGEQWKSSMTFRTIRTA